MEIDMKDKEMENSDSIMTVEFTYTRTHISLTKEETIIVENILKQHKIKIIRKC